MSIPALEVTNLGKRYRVPGGAPLVALEGVSFSVEAGQVVALLGPNGAGKTTAMQLALGLLDRDEGQVRLFGEDPELLEVRRKVGFAPDAPLFPKRLTGLEVLQLHGALLGIDKFKVKTKSLGLLEQLGLGEAGLRACAGYSRGQGQRLGLAVALLGDPELLFLDEPTAGLDPAGVAAMRELLSSLRARGVAVLLNSHLLSEVEKVCDVALFIKGGKLLHKQQVAGSLQQAEVRLANADAVRAQLLAAIPGATIEGNLLRAPLETPEGMPALVKLLGQNGAEIIEAKLAGAVLERLYLEIVEGHGSRAVQAWIGAQP